MGKQTIFERVREWLAGVCWHLFLRLNKLTKEEYWRQIIEQEKLKESDLMQLKDLFYCITEFSKLEKQLNFVDTLLIIRTLREDGMVGEHLFMPKYYDSVADFFGDVTGCIGKELIIYIQITIEELRE